jgi:hypothetical protein
VTVRPPAPRDYAWAALALVTLLLFLGSVLNAVWEIVSDGRWLTLLAIPGAAIFYWWLGVGA